MACFSCRAKGNRADNPFSKLWLQDKTSAADVAAKDDDANPLVKLLEKAAFWNQEASPPPELVAAREQAAKALARAKEAEQRATVAEEQSRTLAAERDAAAKRATAAEAAAEQAREDADVRAKRLLEKSRVYDSEEDLEPSSPDPNSRKRQDADRKASRVLEKARAWWSGSLEWTPSPKSNGNAHHI